MERRGFSFGTTSDNPHPLTRDDDGLAQTGSVRSNHIDSRGRGDPKGYGPKDARAIDARANRGTSYPGGSVGKAERRPTTPSVSRARAGSDSEWWDGRWFGDPPRRGG